MLQMDFDSLSKPFSIVYRNCLKAGFFSTAWKKANVVPVHKKGNKQIIDLFSSCLFVVNFEKIIFDTIFQHLTVNKLFNPDQSGLLPDYSCKHQLISITHEIYASFDANPSLEVRVLFKYI